MEISQDQLGEGEYADVQRQSLYDDHFLDLCHKAVLNAWGKIGEVGNKIKSFTQVIEGQKYAFTDFLQRLASAVNRMIPDKEGR